MDDAQFDTALIGMAMTQAEAVGWPRVSVVEAAREAGLPLERARARFAGTGWILLRLGLLADQAALADTDPLGTTREKLFDALMRRFDALQPYRGGLRSVLRALPLDPGLALMLAADTRNSMRWMAQAAGLDTAGLRGSLRVSGLFGVWVQTVRAWERDDSADLSGTMAALDRALDRAESLGRFLGTNPAATSAEPAPSDPVADPAPDPVPDAPFTSEADPSPEI